MIARSLASWLLLALLLIPGSVLAQCETWLAGPLDDGTLQNGSDGSIRASMRWDPDGAGPLPERLVVAGSFSSIGGVAANNIAYYDPSLDQWVPFGNGIGANVYSLTVFNGQVVAGCAGDSNTGTFDQTVRRWNGSSWEGLSATSTGSVYALTVHNGVLFAAGNFTTTFVDEQQGPIAYLGAYNPATDLWIGLPEAGLGTQINTRVNALASYGGELYVGGNIFSNQTVTNSAIFMARGNLDTVWTPLTHPTETGSVNDFELYAGELVVGGGFSSIGGVACKNIAGWNGTTFHAFDSGTASPIGESAAVHAIEVFDGLVIGGEFLTASGTTVNRVARWAPGGFFWQTVGQGTDDTVFDLTFYRDRLIAVGLFDTATYPAGGIAVWDGVNWSPLSGGSAAGILAFTVFNGRLVAGGSFQQPTFSLGSANHVASWNGTTFAPFGTGMSSQVHALEAFKYAGAFGKHELIAGGVFTNAGGVTALRIARWVEDPFVAFPPPAWQAMGSGFNSNVNAIERASGFTYAGGNFTFSGATPISRIARWNEITDVWEAMGTGMNGSVFALKEFGGFLYAGGSFTSAGGVSTGGLARWNGSSWSQVGGFFLGTVYALEVHNGELYIGGNFAGLPNGSNIAKYNGTSYSNVGSGGTNATVFGLFSSAGRLYMGGDFTLAGGVSASRVAYWDGSQWHQALGGADGTVRAFGRYGSETHVGGNFGTVADPTLVTNLPTPRWARLNETGLPWFTLNPFSKVVSLYTDVSFSATLQGGYSGLTYQWMHDGVPLVDGPGPDGSIISGANSEVLTISNVVFSDKGAYRLEATASCGTVTSSTATLSFDVTDSPVFEPRISSFDGIGANPSSGPTVLSFSLALPARVEFTVHDVRGRRVRRVDVGQFGAGRHQAHWDARDEDGRTVAAGVYFVRLELNGEPLPAKRLTIVR